MILILGIAAHVAAAFGVFWAFAFGAHVLGLIEDPRILMMAPWERVIIVAWGLAAVLWWFQWSRFRRGGA